MSRYLIDRIAATPNVELLTDTEVMALGGADQGSALHWVRWRNRRTGGEEHRGRAPKGTKCHVEQQKDAREAERHHDRESLRGRLQAFELAAPFEVIARRQLHLRDLLLRFGDKGARITAFQVHLHDDAPLAILAADLVQALDRKSTRDLGERNLPPQTAFLRKQDRHHAEALAVDD